MEHLKLVGGTMLRDHFYNKKNVPLFALFYKTTGRVLSLLSRHVVRLC